MLFVTNVVAILASGIVVMALYRVRAASGLPARPVLGSAGTSVVIGCLLVAVIVPLWLNSQRVDRTNIRVTGVEAVADRWADDAGWTVLAVRDKGDTMLLDATGPAPSPSLVDLRDELDVSGLGGFPVRVHLLTERYVPLPN